ncbi:Uncharacterized protein PBTT_06602 [Plasmodiophora brassicae]|uniref:Uncharacterized protein n=1 Tax=Plasmodiophora brassicae TaxID=37360 RepID=A0A0G4IVM2_PLABS|nr:hypothetical protein PBRA_001193 [Plasmodiophora brassicae]SPQ97303.1 unnamed protein product [Plasmodiophora brassicae]
MQDIVLSTPGLLSFVAVLSVFDFPPALMLLFGYVGIVGFKSPLYNLLSGKADPYADFVTLPSAGSLTWSAVKHAVLFGLARKTGGSVRSWFSGDKNPESLLRYWKAGVTLLGNVLQGILPGSLRSNLRQLEPEPVPPPAQQHPQATPAPTPEKNRRKRRRNSAGAASCAGVVFAVVIGSLLTMPFL